MSRPALKRQLSIEQEQSVKYLQAAVLKWKKEDLEHRVNMRQKEIWKVFKECFTDPSKAVSESAFSAQLSGRQIPSYDSILAWIRFADLDTIEAFGVFGKPLPLDFPVYYELIQRVMEKEQWKDRETILDRLSPLRDDPAWQHPTEDSHWIIKLALKFLAMPALSFNEIVYYLPKLVEGYLALPESTGRLSDKTK